MSDTVDGPPTDAHTDAVLQRPSTLDRFLPVWIGVAMAIGLLLARLVDYLDGRVRELLRELVPGIELPASVLDEG